MSFFSSSFVEQFNTKYEAFRLIHDPTRLITLLFSKYGDIEEDFYCLYINQLIYNLPTKYNCVFKEIKYTNLVYENLKRLYKKKESINRIPKLSDYYKNYHLFFCRPNFKDLIISDLMENYGDDKAEVFYKNNYENSKSKNEQSDKNNSESLSSLDNITDNKIIFTKKTKKIIDKNLDNNYGTLTLTTNSINSNLNNHNNIKDKNNHYNDGLISARSNNDSFEKIVHNLIYYKKSKKYDKHKKKEVNNPIKNNINNNNLQLGKKIVNKIGINYGNKKINKNIIYSLNINNEHINPNNDKNSQSKKNKNSLFSLLKSKNLINYTKTENNIIYNTKEKQNNITITINLNKSHNKKNKNNNKANNLFSSPKNNKDNFNLLSKLEEFHTNIIRPNTSFHHKRNKTVYLNQNQIIGTTIPSNTLNNNYLSTLSNILSKNNNTRNYTDNFKTSNSKTTKFNNYLTINNQNNLINKQRGFNEMKNRLKNKTFEVENNNNNIYIAKINNIKENYKIYQKNKINNHNNNIEIKNQVIIKKNNLIGPSGSKFNLTKNPLKMNNNKINKTKNINNNIKYFNPKFSPINCFNKNIINNKNVALHKKSQTTIISNILETSPKNQTTSPIATVKHQNKIFNINQSENITSKIRPKINNSKINNLNINFNNVIFNAPLSNINQNFNVNSNFINNTNENLSYKLLTPTNNIQKNYNNTFSDNKNYNYSNITNNKERQNENINYITNLKNFSNFSRNKINLYESSLSQNDENYSLIKANTNSIKGKIVYDKNRINNQIYYNMYSHEKADVLKKKKNDIIIPIPNNKNISLKKGTKTTNLIKKTKKKIEGRNKKFEDSEKNYGKTETYKRTDINENYNNSFKTKDDNKNNLNIYNSPNTTGRIFTVQPINVNRNTNLISKKIVKTKQRIKLK